MGSIYIGQFLASPGFTVRASWRIGIVSYAMAVNTGHGEQYVPTMVDVLGQWNGKGK